MSAPTPGGPPGALDPARFVRLGLIFYGALAVAAVVWRQGLAGERIFAAPGAPEALGAAALGAGALAGAALGLGTVALSFALTEGTAFGRRLARALGAQLPALSVADALLLACASGLAEELFFRGALQPRVGLVAASLLFGALHLPTERALVAWTLFAAAMGLAFGWLFEATGTLVAPIVAHTLVNAVNLPLLVRRYGAADR